jgi:hypothetical protein
MPILANSGIRIGEANNLRELDVQPITDEQGCKIYRLIVEGKTGRRDGILRAKATRCVKRVFERNAEWLDENNCPSSKHAGPLNLFSNEGSTSHSFDVKPLDVDGSSGSFGLSVS